MGYMFELLAFGSVAFWILLSVVVVASAFFLEQEDGFKTTFLMVVFFVLAYASNRSSFVPFGEWNWSVIALYVAVYFTMGVIWSVVKWYFAVARRVENYEEWKEEFLRYNGIKNISDLTGVLREQFIRDASIRGFTRTPQVSEHKATILMWMSYWPISAPATLLNDPVRKMFRMAYRNIAAQLQNMSDRMFRTVTNDMADLKK